MTIKNYGCFKAIENEKVKKLILELEKELNENASNVYEINNIMGSLTSVINIYIEKRS